MSQGTPGQVEFIPSEAMPETEGSVALDSSGRAMPPDKCLPGGTGTFMSLELAKYEIESLRRLIAVLESYRISRTSRGCSFRFLSPVSMLG